MGFKADLHVHTRMSGDTDAEPAHMVEAALESGLDAIAFTEHYSYQASDYARDLAERYGRRITIFRGVEISAAEGHILVFGLDTDPLGLGGAPAAEVATAAARHGGVVVPSHPFRRGSGIGGLLMELEDIHAVEGHNGANLHAMNLMAVEAAGRLGLPVIGGSDAHLPGEVGACYTEFARVVDEGGLAGALRRGEYTAHDTRKVSRVSWPKL